MFVSESDSDTRISKFLDADDARGYEDEHEDDPHASGGPRPRTLIAKIKMMIVKKKKHKSKKNQEKKEKEKEKGVADSTDAKEGLLSPLIKSKKHFIRRSPTSDKRPTRSSSSSHPASTPTAPSSFSGNRAVRRCGFCFKPPCALESSAESHTSDPNHPDFTFDMLKTLMETNDFYSNECNPHLLNSPSLAFSHND